MRKVIFKIFIILALIVATFYGTNLVWKGWYEEGAGETIITKIIGDKVLIGSKFGTLSPALKTSFIDSEIDQVKREIHVSLYSKFYNWPLPITPSKDEIILSSTGTYKVFYGTGDGTDSLIQEIEYK